jgi:cobalt/nickel transport system permease protein
VAYSYCCDVRSQLIKVETAHHHGHDVGERLYIHRHSVVHSLPAHPKIVAALLFIFTVVATPITWWFNFLGYFALIITVALSAKIPLKTLFTRALIEIPFVFFAVLMPFFGKGETISVGPLNLYEEGLIAAAGILIKGTLGVLTAITLSTSTTAREMLRGLEKLNLPTLMVQIASFMLRYVNVVNDEMERMKIARESRGFVATGIKHWKVLANAAGALFIRSYERGERVHLAMLSRGYTGVLPHDEPATLSKKTWLTALALPIAALLILSTSLGLSL